MSGVAIGLVAAGLGLHASSAVIRTDSGEEPSSWSSKLSIPGFGSDQTDPESIPELAPTEPAQRSTHDVDYSRPGQQAPPSQTKGHAKAYPTEVLDSDDVSAWQKMVDGVVTAKDNIQGYEYSKIGEKISGMIVPRWVKLVPGYINKLQDELSMSPGSLAEEIWQEANNPEINPEIMWDAEVRVSTELCKEEQDFLKKRKIRTTAAFAKYLGLPEDEVHPEDVPIIAMCGSGGGLRALVAGASSYLSAQEAGLFDCVTYTAGVSGSCWLQTLYYSSIGRQNHGHILHHLKHRLGVHIAYPPAALTLLGSAPTNKFLLSGMVEKMKGVPDADFGLVDIYGLLLAARLLVPKGELNIDPYDLKVSNQREYTDQGAYPLPIYTAVRHEIPKEEKKADGAIHDPDEAAKSEAYFQWFEWTPYEFFCEEFNAGIPTWAIGRKFNKGQSVWRENGLALPELRVSLLMGVWGSAFCATLSHYYKEIRPIIKGLAGFGGIDSLIVEKDHDLTKVHAFDPATIPNFAANMKDILPGTCPQSVHEAAILQLMDAGMSNNLPIYPLLRPGRDVDVLIAFDASADVRNDNWMKVADGYVQQRGIKGWPIGAGWPSETSDQAQVIQELESAQVHNEKEARKLTTDAQREGRVMSVQPQDEQKKDTKPKPSDLGYCTVWVGSTEERKADSEPALPKIVEEDWELMTPDAGITVIYFPFLKNEKVPGVDPQTSDFMSTWNFVYTPDEIDKVVQLARANFAEGREQTKRMIRAVWERKRNQRLEREEQDAELSVQRRMRKVNKAKGKQFGEHGDQFS